MTHIREMTAEDAEDVSRLYASSWATTYGPLLGDTELRKQIGKRFTPSLQQAEAEDPDIITLVATENGEIVGASLSKMDSRNQAWLDRLHLQPGYFGTGLATDLLHATIAKHTGLQTIALKVLKGNERAIGFYEKHGFSITDEIANDATVGGVDSVVMTRTIPRS